MDLDSTDKTHYRNLLAQGLSSDTPKLAPDINGYEIIKRLGRGGMSTVYLAKETSLNRLVALKVFSVENMDHTAIERFRQEAVMMADIHHPNTVAIHGVINDTNDTPCLILEYVAGGDLRTKLNTEGTLDLKQAVTIAIDACLGLEAIHAKSIIHRDINPANILLTEDGNAKVADLGIALNKQPDESAHSLTMTGTFVGTMAYLAPEQLSGNRDQIDTRADIWAVGVLLFEMLVGSPPQALLVSDLLTEVPSPLKPIIKKCLRRNPADRYPNITDLKNDLLKINQPNKKTLLTAAALIALTAIAITAYALSNNTKPNTPPTDTPTRTRTQTQPTTETNLLATYPAPNEIKQGNWTLRNGTLSCLPQQNGAYLTLTNESPGDNYDISLTFTRTSGSDSITVYLPTSIGTLNFDLDGWKEHISGIQNLDEQSMRTHGDTFDYTITNNTPTQLLLQVRQHTITAFVNGTKRHTWNLRGHTGSISNPWSAPIQNRIAIGAWNSATTFSKINLKKITAP